MWEVWEGMGRAGERPGIKESLGPHMHRVLFSPD